MNCPYCNREIYGMTGLQEILKFQKHLRKCKKYQKAVVYRSDKSVERAEDEAKPVDMLTALWIRADSGQ